MRVLITGGTGALGRDILSTPAAPGEVFRVQSRGARPGTAERTLEWAQADLATGDGVPAALTAVDAVIHAASDPRRIQDVDVEGTRRLIEAASAARVRHIVYVSIVGIDEIPLSYYRGKLAAERIVASGPVPFSILRVAQFHSLIDRLIATAMRVPLVMPLPTDLRFQSVATSDVARRLRACLVAGPSGRRQNFAGPEVLTLGDAARIWKEIKGVRRRTLHLPVPGRLAAAFRAGKTTAPDAERGVVTWRDWLTHGRER